MAACQGLEKRKTRRQSSPVVAVDGRPVYTTPELSRLLRTIQARLWSTIPCSFLVATLDLHGLDGTCEQKSPAQTDFCPPAIALSSALGLSLTTRSRRLDSGLIAML